MYTRNVTMKLMANSATEFTRLTENEIIPLLRKQPGFRDALTFIAPQGTEAMAISFWDSKEQAEAYNQTAYPEVLKTLVKVIEGTPKVQPFVISNSTFYKIAAKAA